MKFYILIIILLVSTIAQVSIFSQFPVLGIRFELLFAITIYISTKYDWYEGCLTGIWCGLLNDLFSITPFGLSVFVYSIAGFLAAFFENIIFTQHISTRLLILFLMSIFATVITLLLTNEENLFMIMWQIYKFHILSIASVNTLFAVPCYIILDKITYEHQR